MHKILLFALMMLCSACAVNIPTKPATVDPKLYLAQYICKEDGSPALFSTTNPCTPIPQLATAKFTWRKFDIGNFQSEDSVQYGVGQYADIWLFNGDKVFNPQNGDGGQEIALGKDNIPVYIATQDGSKPFVQYFVGYRCSNATGWIIFSPIASGSTIAFLQDESSPFCSSVNGDWSLAYTTWQHLSVPLTFNVFGTPATITADMMVSQHYDRESASASTDMELTGLVKWNGRTIWQDWKHGTGTTSAAVAVRCPMIASLPTPGAGWYLYDCRYDLNIVKADGTQSVTSIGWLPGATDSLGYPYPKN